MSKKICFIINPISGTGKWKGIEDNIKSYLDKSFVPTIIYTERPKQATELAKEAAKTNDIVVAVGGDGLMNEVAVGIMNTNVLLGIIPTGSGNALARHLGIPIDHKKAIECINKLHSATIDSATVNDTPFFAISGTGFDAEVAAKFAKSSKRGFFTYFQLSVVNFFTYKPAEYKIIVDGKEYHKKAFLVTFANGGQYGNNAYIAPEASVLSGQLQVCVLKPFSLLVGPILACRLFTKSLHHSPYLETLKGKFVEISRVDGKPLCIHYDGEVGPSTDKIKLEVKPLTLKVILPEGMNI